MKTETSINHGTATDEVANLFATVAQQIHYKSVINGLDMTSITECFNELQAAYKRKMSREIKFRVWDESQRYMAYQVTPGLETIQSFTHHFGDKKLLQFTGLKDYEGKEIYDGDIVQVEFTLASWWWYANPKPTGGDGYSGVVGLCIVNNLGNAVKIWFPKKDFWFDRYNGLEEKINKYYLNNIIPVKYKCKVIGNIYENPELIP